MYIVYIDIRERQLLNYLKNSQESQEERGNCEKNFTERERQLREEPSGEPGGERQLREELHRNRKATTRRTFRRAKRRKAIARRNSQKEKGNYEKNFPESQEEKGNCEKIAHKCGAKVQKNGQQGSGRLQSAMS